MQLIRAGLVLVGGAPALNPAARVRADAAIRVRRPKPLRGTTKIAGALRHIDVAGGVGLDLDAAAGGFTQALLDAGAHRVYAVDVGVGQLRARIRQHPQVIALEGTNLAWLGPHNVRDPVDVVTMDLSYLAIADAVGQLDSTLLAPDAHLLALVKPTFELRAGTLAASAADVAAAVSRATDGVERHGWAIRTVVPASVRGAKGAVEVFLHATRSP